MADDENLELNELEGEGEGGDAGSESTDMALAMAEEAGRPQGAGDLEAVYDIPVQVSAVLGRASDASKPVAQTRTRRGCRTRSQGRRSDRHLRQQPARRTWRGRRC